jgi:hypothetical protein
VAQMYVFAWARSRDDAAVDHVPLGGTRMTIALDPTINSGEGLR